MFSTATAALRHARDDFAPGDRARALEGNAQLWQKVLGILHQPDNQLSAALRSSLVSLGLSAQQEMARATPDLTFLIAVNDAVTSSLAIPGRER